MASELQHIDDFFRKKNDTLSADVSSADLHWQQMTEILVHDVSLPVKKSLASKLRPLLKYAALITIISSLVYVATTKPPKEKTVPPTASLPASAKLSPTKTKTASAGSQAKKTSAAPSIVKRLTKTTISKPITAIDLVSNNSTDSNTHKNPEAVNAAVFSSFYNELKKPAEKFTIDPNKDTTIYCKEGSTLFIPASSFQSLSGIAVSGTVNIFVQEFYSIADMVGNKLTTLSDGRRLLTGGMLNINATAQGQDIMIKPGSSIHLTMPTRVFDPKMQLFTVAPQASSPRPDTIASKLKDDKLVQYQSIRNVNGINWIASGQEQFFLNERMKYITILNVTDNPYETIYRKNKTIGKFKIPFECTLSTEEMKHELEKRYGRWYNKIKVKREWAPISKRERNREIYNRRLYPDDWYDSGFVGDSVTIPLHLARQFKLVSREDSLAYEEKWRKEYEDAVKRKQAYSQFIQIKDKYTFQISNLGWINCDRFSDYPPSRLTEFAVSPGDEFKETYFEAMLVLERENSALSGYWNNGTIYFSRLPVGEAVHVVCIGVKEGKVFSSIQRFKVAKDEKNELQFTETNPGQFKKDLARFGNVSRGR